MNSISNAQETASIPIFKTSNVIFLTFKISTELVDQHKWQLSSRLFISEMWARYVVFIGRENAKIYGVY